MKTILRLITVLGGVVGLGFLLVGCSPQEPEEAAEESSAGQEAEAQQQQTEFGSSQRAAPDEHRIGAVGFDSLEERGTARPDTHAQGQHPFELLVGTGVDEKRYEELAAKGFPVEEVESEVREALLKSGTGEETAADEAKQIAEWVSNWDETEHTPVSGAHGEAPEGTAVTPETK